MVAILFKLNFNCDFFQNIEMSEMTKEQMDIVGWKWLEKQLKDSGASEEVIENEKIKYVFDNGVVQFDENDDRPVEAKISEPDEKGMCSISLRFFGIKSPITFTKELTIGEELLKYASMSPQEQKDLRKLIYSPRKEDIDKFAEKLATVSIDYTNPSVRVLIFLVGLKVKYTVDNE